MAVVARPRCCSPTRNLFPFFSNFRLVTDLLCRESSLRNDGVADSSKFDFAKELSMMTPLRQRMIEDMKVRNLAPLTQAAYVHQVSMFARHFGRSPEALGPEEIRTYQVYLATEKKLAPRSISIAAAALSFVYNETVRQWWRTERPLIWLFPGKSADKPITRHAVEKACQEAHSRSGISKPITPHSFRHYAGSPTIPSAGKTV